MSPFLVHDGATDDGGMPPTDPADRLRVLVVDADDRVRESLAGLLAIGTRIIVVGSAGGTDQALALAASESPDVVVIDPRLPDMDAGLACIERLRAQSPSIRVVAMGWADAPDPRALGVGVHGWVRKTFRPTELIAAIMSAVDGPPSAMPSTTG